MTRKPTRWRGTYMALAGILAVVTILAHALALRAPWPQPRPPRSTLPASVMYAVVIALVPLLLQGGYSATQAARALGLGGAGQTLSRALYAALARRTSVTTRSTALIGFGGLTTTVFGVVPGPYVLLVAVSVAAGMVRGNLTLLQATAITDRWGVRHYGRLSGLLAVPVTGAAALAPFVGAALTGQLGGYPELFTMLAFVSATAALLGIAGTPATEEICTELQGSCSVNACE